MPNLLETRRSYRPFEYEEAYNYFELQHSAHWSWTHVPLGSDILDWKTKLNDSERVILGGTLKGFTQMETLVGNYWTQRVSNWFPKPEIEAMASTFAAMEAIHGRSYNNLIETLGLEEYDAFVEDSPASERLEYLVEIPLKSSPRDMALSLAIFSGFVEGVSLFSSFAILQYLGYKGLMLGVSKIIEYSSRDECIHSDAGCWLFRQLMSEMPNIDPSVTYDSLREPIYKAAQDIVELEERYLDRAFNGQTLRGLDPEDVKQYVRHRTDSKLKTLGYNDLSIDYDTEAAERIMEWFNPLIKGERQQDFFVSMETGYSKTGLNLDKDDELDFDFDDLEVLAGVQNS